MPGKSPLHYHVRQGVTTLREIGGQLLPGEILVRSNGGLVLHCPVCRAMQIAVEELTGPPDAPTIQEPMLCGSGYCARCKAWFRVVRGVGEVLEEYEPGPQELPAELRAVGVDFPAPLGGDDG